MTLASISRTRLLLWRQACELWGFEIEPPLTRALLALLPLGQIALRAKRQMRVGDEPPTTLSVIETWAVGPDPLGDHRVEREGCHLVVLSWHLQLGAGAGPEGAERLDVTPAPDETHPRIHRHPYGSPNAIRAADELPPPDAWLRGLDRRLGGTLSTYAPREAEQPE